MTDFFTVSEVFFPHDFTDYSFLPLRMILRILRISTFNSLLCLTRTLLEKSHYRLSLAILQSKRFLQFFIVCLPLKINSFEEKIGPLRISFVDHCFPIHFLDTLTGNLGHVG